MVFLKKWVLNIVSLSLFVLLIEILIPSGRIKKVVNMVTGFILVIALINPVLKLLKMDIDLEEFQIESGNFINSKEISINSDVLKEEQIKLMTGVYREKIIDQLEYLAKKNNKVKDVKADVIINEDYNSESYGEVERVYLYLATDYEENTIKPILSIKKIKIGKIGDSEEENQEETSSDKIEAEIEEELKEKIHELFKIQKENIIISSLK